MRSGVVGLKSVVRKVPDRAEAGIIFDGEAGDNAAVAAMLMRRLGQERKRIYTSRKKKKQDTEF